MIFQTTHSMSREMDQMLASNQLDFDIKHQMTTKLAEMLIDQADLHVCYDYAEIRRTMQVAVLSPTHYRRITQLVKQLFADSTDPRIKELVQLLEFPETIK